MGIKNDILYILINYFIENIPFWTIRKAFLCLLGMKIGKNSRIAMKCIIFAPKKIEIGENSTINEHCLLDGRGYLKIGNNNSISMYSKIYTRSHLLNSDDFSCYEKKVEIKDNCWLGAACVIMPGSIINDFSVVSVNSVFKGISEEKGVYSGNPVVLLKKRTINKKYSIEYKSWFR